MSNIDKQALRQLATDAHELGIIKRYSKGLEAQRKFYAAATPLVIRALLDELEASQSENERLAKTLTERNGEPVEGLVKRVAELEEIATDYGMKFQRAQDALKQQSLLHKSQLETAEKRIADLEAREVKLPELKMLRDYLAEVTMREREDILVGIRLEFFRALEEAGVKSAAAAGKGE
ncbi:ead/Ea22-like family protein [Citrobacter koseri]|uniref:ead/Ea22-like family protein n=1 Tax=Citrobacter koseri TaxID=545 RepID=UPI0019043725|nr:ead/Ea22-like family protein [Citrobacter koseri]MBJ8809862.1 ead/Ea22-like family protein [Citrobacter koseri]